MHKSLIFLFSKGACVLRRRGRLCKGTMASPSLVVRYSVSNTYLQCGLRLTGALGCMGVFRLIRNFMLIGILLIDRILDCRLLMSRLKLTVDGRFCLCCRVLIGSFRLTGRLKLIAKLRLILRFSLTGSLNLIARFSLKADFRLTSSFELTGSFKLSGSLSLNGGLKLSAVGWHGGFGSYHHYQQYHKHCQ